MTDEDDEFVRIEKESLWRKRQIEENLGQPVYFKPKKEWVGLTDEEINSIDGCMFPMSWARKIEAKLKEKNHV
jgi:uncharacterized UPF0160 family protein